MPVQRESDFGSSSHTQIPSRCSIIPLHFRLMKNIFSFSQDLLSKITMTSLHFGSITQKPVAFAGMFLCLFVCLFVVVVIVVVVIVVVAWGGGGLLSLLSDDLVSKLRFLAERKKRDRELANL